MLGRIRERVTYANVTSSLALVIALSTGTAYAANTIGTSDIIDGEVRSVDIRNGTITSDDMASSAITNTKIASNAVGPGKVIDDSLTASDLATASVEAEEIASDAVGATEVANNSIDAGEVVDFGLSNQDVGVLFAEVAANATLSNASGAVTVTRVGAVGAGTYEVDFGRNISACTAVATLGTSSTASQLGEVNVADRSGNSEAVFVDTNTSSGAAADKAFRLVVVC
jgi:hypothetical protein